MLTKRNTESFFFVPITRTAAFNLYFNICRIVSFLIYIPFLYLQVVAEEEQQFLGRQQVFLQQGVPAPGSGPGVPAGVQKTPDRKVLGSPGVQGSPKKVS